MGEALKAEPLTAALRRRRGTEKLLLGMQRRGRARRAPIRTAQRRLALRGTSFAMQSNTGC